MAGASDEVLKRLTPAQREAVEHFDGPLLVLAAAGSGKTRVITHRVARLVSKGVPAREILSITFTNKAADEMKRRVAAMLPSNVATEAVVSTFHSFCARLLRREIGRLGYPNEFTIYDEEDAAGLLKNIISSQFPEAAIRPRPLRAAISRWKSALVGPDEAYTRGAASSKGRTLAEIYRLYQERLRSCGALDFDDLLLKALEVLRLYPNALGRWQDRFRFLQVDETQDTNLVQYEIAKLLAGERRNLALVGDPDQSIYSWRGAEPGNIDSFTRDFPRARVVRLDTNFRSTQAILDAASALISQDPGPRAGRLTGTEKMGSGERPTVVITESGQHEADEIARRIDRLTRKGTPAGAIAVFYRTNAQSRVIEQVLTARGIDYSVVGSVAFFQRKEVKDALAYLRIAVNPKDDVSLVRVAGVPRRGIGEAALASLGDEAASRGLSLAEALPYSKRDGLTRRSRGKEGLKELARVIGLLGELVKGKALPAVRAAVEVTGLKKFYEEEPERVENLDELLNAAQVFDERRPEGLAGFLEEAALLTDADRWRHSSERVVLMTLHTAKGLEFPVVFIAGLEDGLLPHARSLAEGTGSGVPLDEERRLLYVGMTRAEGSLFLLHARSRRSGGQLRMSIRSRFLSEVPEELLRVEDETAGELWTSAARPGMGMYFRKRAERAPRVASDEEVPDEDALVRRALAGKGQTFEDDVSPEPIESLRPGDRVVHPKYGPGEVVSVKGVGAAAKATIDFASVGRKTIALGFVELGRG